MQTESVVSGFHTQALRCGLKTRDIAKKVILVAEMICGIQLYKYQSGFALAIITAVLARNGDDPTGLFSRQSGKTEVVAVVAIGCAVVMPTLAKEFPDDERVASFKEGFRVGCYGPKQDKAQLAYDRIRKYAESDLALSIYSDPAIGIELTASRGDSLAWSNGSYILAQTASEQVDNEGETWHLLILDESQKMTRRKIEKELEPMLASTNGPMVLIGTASSSKGYFFKQCEDNTMQERQHGRRLHFEYDYEKVIRERQRKYDEERERYARFVSATPAKQLEMLERDPLANTRPSPFHLNYAKHIEKKLRKLRGNKDDESFKMNYRLLWQDSRMIAIPQDLWRGCAIPNLEMGSVRVKAFITAGLDIAKGDSDKADETVLSIWLVDTTRPTVDPVQDPNAKTQVLRYPRTCIDMHAFQGSFENHQYKAIVDVCRSYPSLKFLLCDSTGLGDPVTERLQVLLQHIQVEGYPINSSAAKSRMYKQYLMDLNSRLITYAAGPETRLTKVYEDCMFQHEGLQRWYDGAGYLHCEAEEGEHDDYPDSFALGNMACELALESRKDLETVESSVFTPHGVQNGYPSAANSNRADRYRTGRRSAGRR